MVKHGRTGRRRLRKLGTDGSVAVAFVEGKSLICFAVKEMHWAWLVRGIRQHQGA